jgi:hypothetical protein
VGTVYGNRLGIDRADVAKDGMFVRVKALRKAPHLPFCAVLACTTIVLCDFPAPAAAQVNASAPAIGTRLPADAPVYGTQSSSQKSATTNASASVEGSVLDISGASVLGALVSLMQKDGTEFGTQVSTDGDFAFTRIPPGSYFVIVMAKDFVPFKSAEFMVIAQQAYEIPDVTLMVAGTNTAVTVRPTDWIAAEQMKTAESQRLGGIIPNFYTSYVYDAAPLTPRQKFSLAARGTFDPVSLIGVGVAAGMEQASNTYAGYGQGFSGYSKRYAAKFADGRISDFLTHAVFPSLLHQDPRYYYQGAGSIKSRLAHAVVSAFVTRTDSGLTAPNYSYVLGDMCSGALSNLYYPAANRGASLVFTNAALGLAGRVGTNILREFSKRYTTNALGAGKK